LQKSPDSGGCHSQDPQKALCLWTPMRNFYVNNVIFCSTLVFYVQVFLVSMFTHGLLYIVFES